MLIFLLTIFFSDSFVECRK